MRMMHWNGFALFVLAPEYKQPCSAAVDAGKWLHGNGIHLRQDWQTEEETTIIDANRTAFQYLGGKGAGYIYFVLYSYNKLSNCILPL